LNTVPSGVTRLETRVKKGLDGLGNRTFKISRPRSEGQTMTISFGAEKSFALKEKGKEHPKKKKKTKKKQKNQQNPTKI